MKKRTDTHNNQTGAKNMNVGMLFLRSYKEVFGKDRLFKCKTVRNVASYRLGDLSIEECTSLSMLLYQL